MGSTRKLMRKRIRCHTWSGNPDDPEYVDIPVVTEIEFKDPKHNYQETVYRVNNTDKADREVHVKEVHAATGSGNNPSFDAQVFIEVERIDVISFADAKTNYQETGYRPRSDDPPPSTAEGNTGDTERHRKVRYLRYTKDNQAGTLPWIDVEVLSEIEFADPKDNYQETVYRFNIENWDDLEIISDTNDPYATNFEVRLGYCDPELDMFEENASEDIDPPYRLDPFQNIVNCSFRPDLIVLYTNLYAAFGDEDVIFPSPGGSSYECGTPGSAPDLPTEDPIDPLRGAWEFTWLDRLRMMYPQTRNFDGWGEGFPPYEHKISNFSVSGPNDAYDQLSNLVFPDYSFDITFAEWEIQYRSFALNTWSTNRSDTVFFTSTLNRKITGQRISDPERLAQIPGGAPSPGDNSEWGWEPTFQVQFRVSGFDIGPTCYQTNWVNPLFVAHSTGALSTDDEGPMPALYYDAPDIDLSNVTVTYNEKDYVACAWSLTQQILTKPAALGELGDDIGGAMCILMKRVDDSST